MAKGVIYLRRKHLAVFVDGEVNRGFEIDWDGIRLSEAFSKIRRQLHLKKLTVLLGADASYCLSLPAAEKLEREEILKEAQAHVPEDLNDHNFDWKKVGERVQAVASSPFLLSTLVHAADGADLDLETVIPGAIILATLANPKTITLVLWQGVETLAAVCHEGVVYLVESLDEITADRLAEIVAYAKDKYALPVEEVLTNLARPIPLEGEIKWRHTELPVYRTALNHPSTSGEDSLVLSLPGSKTPMALPEAPASEPAQADVPAAAAAPPTTRPKPALPIILGGVLFGLLAVLAVGIAGVNRSQVTSEPEPTPTPTPTVVATPTPTPELNLADFPVRVENGSGTAGRAKEVADLLEAAGFSIESTGNAGRFDYIRTVISTKPGVPQEVGEKIIEALAGDYEATVSGLVGETEAYDVLVVVGPKQE